MQPELTTERLVLRPFLLTDAEAVSVLAGDEDIARNTLNIPYPYDREHAEEWITAHPGQFDRREAVTYAVDRGLDRFEAYVDSPEFEDFVRENAQEIVREVADEPVGGILTPARA